jgi:hypothetical protein
VALALASILGPCQDGIDNDGDNLTDALEDPGCRNADWFSESPQCDDGIDNDGDGRIDLDDLQCGNAWQIREAQQSGCGLGFELIALIVPLSRLRSRIRGVRRS